jgi:hypothetical protein
MQGLQERIARIKCDLKIYSTYNTAYTYITPRKSSWETDIRNNFSAFLES